MERQPSPTELALARFHRHGLFHRQRSPSTASASSTGRGHTAGACSRPPRCFQLQRRKAPLGSPVPPEKRISLMETAAAISNEQRTTICTGVWLRQLGCETSDFQLSFRHLLSAGQIRSQNSALQENREEKEPLSINITGKEWGQIAHHPPHGARPDGMSRSWVFASWLLSHLVRQPSSAFPLRGWEQS